MVQQFIGLSSSLHPSSLSFGLFSLCSLSEQIVLSFTLFFLTTLSSLLNDSFGDSESVNATHLPVRSAFQNEGRMTSPKEGGREISDQDGTWERRRKPRVWKFSRGKTALEATSEEELDGTWGFADKWKIW